MRKNIFIYGSCVSRDALHPVPDNYYLAGYVARQSVISAMSKPTNLLTGPELESKFQNRMLDGDIASNLMPSIRAQADKIDLLLIDLTDERLGVHKLPDSTFVTHSTELVKSQRLHALHPRPGVIALGTERHTRFWSICARKFYAELDALGLRDRCLVVNTPWATKSEEGDEVEEFRRTPTELMNSHFEALAHIVRDLGYKVVDMPRELSVTTSSHKWGAAPFHFTPPAQEWIRTQIDQALL